MNQTKFHALVLGHDHELVEAVSLAVRQDGGLPTRVGDETSALKILQTQPVDVVFMDLKSAEAESLQLLQQIKVHPLAAPVFTIGLGTGSEVAACRRAFDLEMNEFIQTPLEVGIFQARVAGAVQCRRKFEALQKQHQELTDACRLAEANSRAKSDFLAAMSHEIRTPMNGVIAMTSLLMETSLTADQRSYVDTIYNSSESLLKIINDILDFSKIEAGKMELERRPFDLRAVIEESFDLLATRAFEKRIDIVYEADDVIPTLVEGDAQRLRQVLVNLLGNALKFTEHGGVLLKVEKLSVPAGIENPRGARLHFSVRDSGIGISADRLARLFRPFVQADVSTSRKYGGTGLGLVISRRLVELMGGKMWAESVTGEGATFHFTVNLSIPEDSKPPAHTARQPRLADLRVMILEDGEMVRRFLVEQCRRWGMQPQVVDNSAHALEVLRQGAVFDLALVDAQLPDVDGATVAEEMQKFPSAAMLPVIFMTVPGKNNHEGGEEPRVMFSHTVAKPVRPGQLCAVMERSMLSPRSAPEPPQQHKLELTIAQRFPLRILLVDDNVINQKVAMRILQQMGYLPAVASNGREAVEFVAHRAVDMVLMDVMMPEMDGLEATRLIRQRQAIGEPGFQSRIVVIAMTAHAMQGDREKCLGAGMDDYLSKPVRPKDVREMIERWGATLTEVPMASALAPAADQADEADPVDMSRINELTDGNMDSLRELVDIFFKQTQGQFVQLRTAIKDGHADQVRRVAHSCAGASATLGMVRLVPLVRQLEKLGASGTLTGAGDICENAAREFEFIRQFLKANPELAPVVPDSNAA
jgi:signal transduction histidine kinase/HPt (histidine-containing phosphotransfer) domain-containing protein